MNHRPPVRSPLRETNTIAWQDFAPRSASKQPNTSFSPPPSPQPTSPTASPPPSTTEPGFMIPDAISLDRADRARHDLVRAQHRAGHAALIQRLERHRNMELLAQQSAVLQHSRAEHMLRRTGAALLEYRRNQKTEMLARQATRRSQPVSKVAVDTTLADKTAAVIERQRVRKSKQKQRRDSHRELSVDSQAEDVSATTYETSGADEAAVKPAQITAGKKHTEDVYRMCLQMEGVLGRL